MPATTAKAKYAQQRTVLRIASLQAAIAPSSEKGETVASELAQMLREHEKEGRREGRQAGGAGKRGRSQRKAGDQDDEDGLGTDRGEEEDAEQVR